MPQITKTDERWFEYPNDPLKGRVKIKHLSPGENAEITDESFKTKYNYKANKGKKSGYTPEIDIKQNSKSYRELPIIKSITDWENFVDEKEKPMDCNPENIQKCIQKIDGFVEFIDECREILSDDIKKEKKEQLKNLKGSASEQAK